MKLSKRQETIAAMVKADGPITGKEIAARLHVTRSALRSDLTVLTMTGLLDARPKVGYYYVGTNRPDPAAEEINRYKVSQVMAQAVAVTPGMSLYDTIVMMFTEDVGTLLVCEDGYLVGLVSRKDLLRAAIGQNDPNTMPISMVMTPASKVIWVGPEDSVVDAAQRMIDYEIDCVPVIEREDVDGRRKLKVVGRVSKTSIVKVSLECGLK